MRVYTNLPYWEHRPTWAPAGNELAFAAALLVPWYQSDIFRVPASGGNPTNITTTYKIYEDGPSWSPDGGYIAYEASLTPGGAADVYVMPVSGGTAVNITNHPANDYAPAWSPDGSRIAFVSDRDGNDEIYVLYLSGEAVTPASLGKIKALFR